ncbi:MAG: transglutaminase family protein [Sphingomonadaceae bacterium]
MTLFAIRHLTCFSYEKPVHFSRSNLRLEPIAWPGQTLVSHKITINPGGQLAPAPLRSALVNLTRLIIPGATTSLEIISESRVQVDRIPQLSWLGEPSIAEVGRLARESADISDLSPANFLYPSSFTPVDAGIADWSADALQGDRPVFAAAYELAVRIQREFRYDPNATMAETQPAVAFAARAGVCQDFSQIMICALRAAGIPAAYASGYIRTEPAPGQDRLQGADATHGWVLAWCGPEKGWLGLDPTNGIAMGGDHIIMAVGRDYLDIAPIDGVFNGYGAQEIFVEVDVEAVGD